MSCVILAPSRVILRRSRRISKAAQGRLRRRISERSKILHGACPETLRRVYPERDARSFAESTLSDANVLRMTQREGLSKNDSRRIQDDRLYPEIHNRAIYSANL